MIPRSTIGERSVALFLLGTVAFSPPLLAIAQLPAQVFGIPLLYVYLFAAWSVIIVLQARTARRATDADDIDDPPDMAADSGEDS